MAAIRGHSAGSVQDCSVYRVQTVIHGANRRHILTIGEHSSEKNFLWRVNDILQGVNQGHALDYPIQKSKWKPLTCDNEHAVVE